MSQHKKRKGEVEELGENYSLLDLSLSSNYSNNNGINVDESSKAELNLLDLVEDQKNKAKKERTYSCKHCNKEFHNSQALGGHQNAHRRERAFFRRVKLGQDFVFPFGLVGANSVYPIGGFGGQFNRGLGTNADSMIHKPLNYHVHGGLVSYGYWPIGNLGITNQRPRSILGRSSAASISSSLDSSLGINLLGSGNFSAGNQVCDLAGNDLSLSL